MVFPLNICKYNKLNIHAFYTEKTHGYVNINVELTKVKNGKNHPADEHICDNRNSRNYLHCLDLVYAIEILCHLS